MYLFIGWEIGFNVGMVVFRYEVYVIYLFIFVKEIFLWVCVEVVYFVRSGDLSGDLKFFFLVGVRLV